MSTTENPTENSDTGNFDPASLLLDKKTVDVLVANIIPTSRYFELRFDHMQEQIDGVKSDIGSMRSDIDKRFEQVDKRFERARNDLIDLRDDMDKRFEQVDRRFEQVC